MAKRFVVGVLVLCLAAAVVAEVIPEPNVNMVSGTVWPLGDPYLQRQNEGSIAISTRRYMTLLGGANDYRTVDVPFNAPLRPDGEDSGDAWIGVFKSRNGGSTWTSTLLPGYPQDTTAAGMASPLKGYQAAADPVVRAGANGMFYMTGIVLNRDASPLSGVFVTRFIDNNHKEAGDTIQYLGTSMIDRGTPGTFIDKPWIATAPGTGQCTVNGQTFQAQNVYLGYTQFVGSGNNLRTKLMFARSTDCGATFGNAVKLSEGVPISQGIHIAIDPNNGTVYAAWRRFQSQNESNAILFAKSTDQGRTFSKPAVIANITPFEQGTSTVSIRTNAYPALAIDATGRLYVAWAQRGVGAGGDARIIMMNSTDGDTWSAPVQVEPTSLRGHQFMPALSVAGGKIVVAYYGLSEDHTVGIYTPNLNNAEVRFRVPEDPDEAEVFTDYLMDAAPPPFTHLSRRHTIDLRAAHASVGVMPVFSSTRVSRYTSGSRPSSPVCAALGKSSCVEQLQFNAPNLPMFRLGTVPFFGDYIDIASHSSTAGEAVHYAVWTDNRDVRPPADGNWSKYTPPGNQGGQPSKMGAGASIPVCEAGFTSSRNQNIYMARITEGLFAAAAGNAKGLNIQRAFPVFVQNAKKTPTTYRLTINQQPPAGMASWEQFNLRTSIDLTIPARSSATRSVFIKSSDAEARVTVNITEVANGAPVPNGLKAAVVLNPDVSNPDVSNPDVSNPDVSNQDIANSEVHNPDVSNPDVSNPDVSNPDVSNPDVSNPDVSNPDVSNPDVSNPDVSNPDVSNPDVSNPDVSNPDVSNADVANGAVSDTNWNAENEGNTTSGYTVTLATDDPPPAGVKTQLIINRIYRTPVARGCTLGENVHRQVIANINNPQFTSFGQLDLANDNNGSFWLAPGETARITLRVYNPLDIPWDPVEAITPVVTAQAVNTSDLGLTNPKPARTLTITTRSLPNGVARQPYTATAGAIGGVGAYQWSMSGAPLGLSINPATGVISGVVATGKDALVTITVTDSKTPTAHTTSRTLPLIIAPPVTITTESLPFGFTRQEYYAPLAATGGKGPITWSVSPTFPSGITLHQGFVSGTPTAASNAAYAITATDSASGSSDTKNFRLTVADPLLINTDTIPNARVGEPYSTQITTTGGHPPFSWSVKAPPQLSISQTGVLSGLFTAPNSSFVTVTVVDSSVPPQTAVRQFNFSATGTSINAAQPAQLSQGIGQLGVFDVTGLTTLDGIRMTFTDGSRTVEGFIFQSPSTPQRIYVRITETEPALASGPATAILYDGANELDRNTFTLSTTPGTPIVTAFYEGNGNCGVTSLTPVTTLAPGGTLGVRALGIDTTETQVRYVQGTLDAQVDWTCSTSSSSMGLVSIIPVPRELVPGPVTVYVRTQARTRGNLVPSDWAGPFTMEVPLLLR